MTVKKNEKPFLILKKKSFPEFYYYPVFNITKPSLLTLIAFIIALMFAFKDILFFEALWHDDGLWMWRASENVNFVDSGWRFKMGPLVPFNDWLYSNLMEFNIVIARCVYLSLYIFFSFALYRYLASRFIFFKGYLGMLAVTAPIFLPKLVMPVGLNASYPLVTLFFFGLFLVSFLYVESKASRLNISYAFAVLYMFASYMLCLLVGLTSIFVFPLAILVVLFSNLLNAKQKVLLLPAMLFFGLWRTYVFSINSHKKSTYQSFDVVIDRLTLFLEYSSVLPADEKAAIGFVLLSTFLSVCIFIIKIISDKCWWKNEYVLFFIFSLSWCFCNSIAYLTVSPTFRVYDYVVIFSFGAVLLQFFPFVALTRAKVSSPALNSSLGAVIFTTVLIVLAASKHYTFSNNYIAKKHENIVDQIKRAEKEYSISSYEQILIVGLSPEHPGNYSVNTGLLRFLLKNNAIKGIVGSEFFPNDPFKDPQNWFDLMKGLEKDKTTIMLKFDKNDLRVMPFLLTGTRTPELSKNRFDYELWAANDRGELTLKYESGSIEKVKEQLNAYGVRSNDVVFWPRSPVTERVITKTSAEQSLETSQLVWNEKNKLLHYSPGRAETACTFFLRMAPDLKKPIKLGLKLTEVNNSILPLNMSKQLYESDTLQVNIPEAKDKTCADVEIYQVDVWPFKKITTIKLDD